MIFDKSEKGTTITSLAVEIYLAKNISFDLALEQAEKIYKKVLKDIDENEDGEGNK